MSACNRVRPEGSSMRLLFGSYLALSPQPLFKSAGSIYLLGLDRMARNGYGFHVDVAGSSADLPLSWRGQISSRKRRCRFERPPQAWRSRRRTASPRSSTTPILCRSVSPGEDNNSRARPLSPRGQRLFRPSEYYDGELEERGGGMTAVPMCSRTRHIGDRRNPCKSRPETQTALLRLSGAAHDAGYRHSTPDFCRRAGLMTRIPAPSGRPLDRSSAPSLPMPAILAPFGSLTLFTYPLLSNLYADGPFPHVVAAPPLRPEGRSGSSSHRPR